MLIERFGIITLICGDCMEYMQNCPDKSFDLAIVDPPYGINMDGGGIGISKLAQVRQHVKKDWDKEAPPKIYFDELKRNLFQTVLYYIFLSMSINFCFLR